MYDWFLHPIVFVIKKKQYGGTVMNNNSKVFVVDRSDKSEPVSFGKQEMIESLSNAGFTVENVNYWPDDIGQMILETIFISF